MYSQKIIERSMRDIQDGMGIKLKVYEDGGLDDLTAHLQSLVKSYDKDGKPAEWERAPTQQEWDYINNERLMCKINWPYFSSRYCNIQIVANDGSPVRVDRLGKYGLMRTQEALLRRVAIDEEAMYDAYDRGESIFGLLYFVHKARQTGFTALVRMMEKHRTIFYPDTQSLAASVNEDMVHELYQRDKVLYDHLPWFIKPTIKYDTKDGQLAFEGLNTATLYHQGNQKGGMGTGRTISVAHLTECALWDQNTAGPYTNTGRILSDLFPSIPKSVNTLYIMESTAMGIGGFWYDQVELIRAGSSRFKLHFCPWYVADSKYVETPKPGWEPDEYTLHVADVVAETSYEYLGYKMELTREQMCWYENTMNEHTGRLFTFFSNFPTTVEESFQNSGNCAFSYELLAELGKGVGPLSGAYDVQSWS